MSPRLCTLCLAGALIGHLVAAQALACGEWRLELPAAKQSASFWVSGTLVQSLDRPKARQVSAYAIAGSSLATMSAKLRGKVIRFEGRDLRVGAVAVATLDEAEDGGALQIGDVRYRTCLVQVDPVGQPASFRMQVEVERAGEPWGSGHATSLCLGGPPAEKPDAGQLADERTDIVRRGALLALWATPGAWSSARNHGDAQ